MNLQRKSTQKGVPGLPLAAMASIKDENVRQVLQALADGWALRNGNTGAGGARFVTLEELEGVKGKAIALEGAVGSIASTIKNGTGGVKFTAGQISAIIGDLEAQIMASLLWRELGERVTLLSINSRENAAKIEEETVRRLNDDNAIVQQTMTQYAVINGNVAALQQQFSTTANNVAALSQALTTIQATVGQNVAAIQQETTARVTSDNDIYAKYSVKIDTNGYVSGFGLMSTANNGAPISHFIVRADRFAIGSPSGPNIEPTVPFIVLTTPDAKGNPPGVYMRNAMIAKAAIGEAQIEIAAVNTLTIKGNAVTVPAYASGSQKFGNGSQQVAASVTIDVGPNPCTVFAVSTGTIGYGSGWKTTSTFLTIGSVGGGSMTVGGGSNEGWTNAAHSVAADNCVGVTTATLYFTGPAGSNISSQGVLIMAAKR